MKTVHFFVEVADDAVDQTIRDVETVAGGRSTLKLMYDYTSDTETGEEVPDRGPSRGELPPPYRPPTYRGNS